MERLNLVLQRLKECNLKLAPEKCVFLQQKVKFLGHVVSGNGVETDPDKTEKVQNWPTPANADELRSFLAFAGYYRRFIKDFSKISRPLCELLPGTATKKGKKVDKPPWKWTDIEQETFDHIKQLLSSPPILAYPDFSQPFELHVDASTKALGAVLYQEQEGLKRVIAYASRALTKAERNYSAFRLEFLALKWAVTEKFSDYLMGTHFTVFTDNNPLTHILTSAKLDATGQRWASALGQYSFDIIYRSGLKNADADGMSRYPYQKLTENEDSIKIEDNTVKAICSRITVPLVETLPCANLSLLETFECPGQTLAQKELREIRRAQREDPVIETWRRAVIDQAMPKIQYTNKDMTMRKQFKNLFMKRGILYRKVNDKDDIIEQLVLPDSYKDEVLKGLHNDIGHPGMERTMRLLRERFYWPGIYSDVENWIKTCDRCLRRKQKVDRAPMVSINTTYPLELVCMDYLTLEPSRGVGNVLVITDHFTKFALAIPTRNQTAKTTADAFFNNFIVHYGIPTRIHSDQGANFESELIKELCSLMNMDKSHTTPYHPQGNAGPERFNRTLLDMLGTLDQSKKPDWKNYINPLVFAYNCIPHETTMYSPFELMFGRKPKLPIDSVFESIRDPENDKPPNEYIEDLRIKLQQTQEIVKEHAKTSKDKQKKYYDRKAKAALVEVGDFVLVRKVKFDGKHKIEDRFEEDVYQVVEQPNPQIPVFKIKSGDKERTLHRNLLFLLNHQEDDKMESKSSTDDSDIEESFEEEATEVGFREDRTDEEESDVTTDSDSEDDDFAESANLDGDAYHSCQLDESYEKEENETETVAETLMEPEEDLTPVSVEENEETEEANTVINEGNVEEVLSLDSSETSDVEERSNSDNTVERPIPTPRRSTRDRRLPERYHDYQMFQTNIRPVDRKLEAFNVLISSGVLNQMDSDTAHKVLFSVLST